MFRRIKNLWFLSNLNITLDKEDQSIFIDHQKFKVKARRREALIIDVDDPLNIDLGYEDV